MKCLIYIFITALILLPGCSRRRPGVYISESGKKYEDLSLKDILVEVDGKTFTKGDAESAISLRKKLLSLISPRLEVKALDAYADKVKRRISREWMLKTLFLGVVEKEGLESIPEDLERHGEFMSAALKKKIGGRQEGWRAALGGDFGQFEKEKNDEILLWALYRSRGLTDVPAKSISNHLARITRYNEDVAESNRCVVAKGKRIFEEIKAGLDFKKAVKSYSEETYPLPEGDMGWCTAEEIDEDDINSVVFTASVNSVLGPFDTEDGIQIIRVEGHDEFATVDKKVKGNVRAVKLRRIRLRMLLPAKPLTEKEAYREIVKSRIESFKRKEYPELKASAVICYPNGTNFFPKVKNEWKFKQKGITP